MIISAASRNVRRVNQRRDRRRRPVIICSVRVTISQNA